MMRSVVTSAFATLALLSSTAMAKEYIVKLKSDQRAFVETATELEGLKILDRHPEGRLIKVDIPENDQENFTNQLAQFYANPMVEYIVPNVKFQMFERPNDPKYGQQWAMEKVNASKAWNITSGQRSIVVAVIDTGIDTNHEDLRDHIYTNAAEIPGNGIDDDGNGFVDDVHGWDFNGNDNNPMDETSAQNPGHGTHCAGIIGASFNNGLGIAGIAPGITLMPVRFIGADGSGDLMGGAKSIDYAVMQHADVISASWGATVQKSEVMPILEAIERANAKGVAFVVAAANDGKDNDKTNVYPANAEYDNVIAVAASGASDDKPYWSNYGRAMVHVAAPGDNIFSSLPGNKYGNLSGTSMATPLVAGLVALVKSEASSEGRTIKPLEIRSILQATGADVNIQTACQCRVDAEAALLRFSKDELTVVPAALTVVPGGSASFSGFGGKAPYSFTSSNPAVASVSADGHLTAQSEGEVKVTIQDADGVRSVSKSIWIAPKSDPGSGGGDNQCPYDPQTCSVLCLIFPNLPWCH